MDNLENGAEWLRTLFHCYWTLGSNKCVCKCVTGTVAAKDLSAFLSFITTRYKYTSACVWKCKVGGRGGEGV